MEQIFEPFHALLNGIILVGLATSFLAAFFVSCKSRQVLPVLIFAGLFLWFGHNYSAEMPGMAAHLFAISTGLSVGCAFKGWKGLLQEIFDC